MATTVALREIDPTTLSDWLARDATILVDVREADEYAREHVAGARSMPLGNLNGHALMGDASKPVVLMCNSGNRSREAAATLAPAPGELYHLEGGLQAWKQAGLPVAFDAQAPMPIMRQVQISAGALVVLGVLLAILVSPWFMALSAFVGAGLMFAGISGFCGMARVLELLPYNRRTRLTA